MMKEFHANPTRDSRGASQGVKVHARTDALSRDRVNELGREQTAHHFGATPAGITRGPSFHIEELVGSLELVVAARFNGEANLLVDINQTQVNHENEFQVAQGDIDPVKALGIHGPAREWHDFPG
jgi:hypothetical protein